MSGNASYTYQAAPSSGGSDFIIRSTDNAYIPLDLGNMDYQRFLEWLAAGNPAPAGWTGPTNPAGGTR